MAIKKIKLPGMTQPVDIGATWANVSGKPDLMTSSEITSAINAAFATNDAMIFKGTIGSGGTVTQLPATHQAGWTYKVISNGSLAGQTCEIGDMIVCVKDGTVANASDWTVIQTNVDGAVTGPASSTAGHIATFTGTTGKAIQDSGFTIAASVPADAVFTDTTYENKTAASGGTDVSLVSTGEKYNWNNRQAKITARGLLKGDGSGGISAATAGTDYATPTQVNAKYTKPSGGIPASDLASGVIPTVPSASSTTPKMDGTASTGSGETWAKGDHVHPTDTSRQAKITASGILKGNGAGNVSAATAGTDYLAPPVLLWENQTPSAEITTKNISIQNLTGYSFLLIEFRLHSSAARSSYALICTANNGIISGGQGFNYGSRAVNINNNTVEIGEFVTSKSDLTDQTRRLLPVKIFGVNL